ncbi:hypothetical protein BDF19DRAFT_409993 [Syncephalis fuscata]|nr:hypothetical protein BDF19DRAFT_409993 [Syncephalis fuscata]
MFIARTLLNVLLLGAAVYAQQPSPTQQPVLSATDTRTMMLPTTSTLASGVSIPAPTNQDRLPINSATARLKTNTTTNSIILTVVIAEADSQRTPAEDMKLVNLTGTGFTPSDAKIYRLAVHTGIAADGDCNNGAIGAMLIPTMSIRLPSVIH